MSYQHVSKTDAQFLLERVNALPEGVRANAREAFEQFHASLCARIENLDPHIRHDKARGGPTYYAGAAFAYVNIKQNKGGHRVEGGTGGSGSGGTEGAQGGTGSYLLFGKLRKKRP